MPLIFQKYLEQHDCHIAVWQKSEEDCFFMNSMVLSESEKKAIELMNPHRKQEWLCSRFLLKHLLSGKEFNLYKDGFGKPFLENSNYFISLSHSNNRAAAIVSKHLVGIDIQKEEKKISKLYPKFISQTEIQAIDDKHYFESYHIFWGGKEAMYKAYGKKSLDFKKHMHVFSFKYYQEELELSGFVDINEQHQSYNIFTHKLDNYFLVYAVIKD